MSSSRQTLARLSSELDIPELSEDWSGIDAILPLVERMRAEGAVVVVKWDGAREAHDAVSVIASRGGLGDGFLRSDTATLEEAMAGILVAYAKKVWLA